MVASRGGWLGWLAAAAALGLFAVRFAHPEVAPFLGDEPQFLAAARAALATGHLPLSSPFVGTQGMRYGPAFVWLQMVVQRFGDPTPETAARVVCVLLTLSQLFLAGSLARLHAGGVTLFALLASVLAMGPSHFYWSRLAWDAPFLCACVSGAVALLALRGPVGMARGLALGVLAGAALATHLMAFPFAVVTGGLLLVEARRERRARAGAAAYGLALGAVCLPYLLFLVRSGFHTGHPDALAWNQLWNYAVQPVRVLTLSGIGYWFGDGWADFLSWARVPRGLDSALKISGVGILGLGMAGGLFWSAFRSMGPERRLARFALVFWLANTAFGAWRHLDVVHPHYQAPSYWIVPVGLAAAWRGLGELRARGYRWTPVTVAPLLVVVLLQGGFIVLWLRYLVARQGVPSHIPISCLRSVVEEVCRSDGASVEVHNKSGMTPYAFRYLMDTDPACAGRQVTLCPPERCPDIPGARALRVVPDGPFTGAVHVEAFRARPSAASPGYGPSSGRSPRADAPAPDAAGESSRH